MHYDGLPAKRTGGCGVRLMKALHQKRTNRKVGENDSDINRADHAAELALLGQFATKLGDAKVGENYARTA